jgi:chromosome segregation ATPase
MPTPTYESVAAVCEKVRETGQKVTLERVKDLHRGSPNRISPFWQQWKREQAEAVQNLDSEGGGDASPVDEDTASIDLAIKRSTEIIRPILEAFVKRQSDRFLDFTKAHQITTERALSRARAELQEQLDDANERLELVQKEFEAEKAEMSAAHSDEIKILKGKLNETKLELTKANSTAVLRRMEAEAHLKEATTAQGELKRLEAVLEERNLALDQANRTIGALEKKLAEKE